MNIDLLEIVLIIVIAGLCWYTNNSLNKVPFLNNLVNVAIVVVSVLVLLQSLGLIGGSSSISIN